MSHCSICILEISSLRKTKRLCLDCEKIEFQELERKRLDNVQADKEIARINRLVEQRQLESQARRARRPPIILVFGIILFSFSIWANGEATDFCEEKFDSNTGTFEGGTYNPGSGASLDSENPFRADCRYKANGFGSTPNGPQHGADIEFFQFHAISLSILFGGIIQWRKRYSHRHIIS